MINMNILEKWQLVFNKHLPEKKKKERKKKNQGYKLKVSK